MSKSLYFTDELPVFMTRTFIKTPSWNYRHIGWGIGL
jgi:hypothetical protein